MKKALNRDVTAFPYKLHVVFEGEPNQVFGPIKTIPSGSNNADFNLSTVYSLISTNDVGSRIVTSIDLLMKSIISKSSSSVNVNGTKATFDLNLSENPSSSIDLPSSTAIKGAKTDSKHGVGIKTEYSITDLKPEKELHVNAYMIYRVYEGNTRTYTKKTGTIDYNYSI